MSQATPAWQLVSQHPGNPSVVAHRGASAYAPENTLAAYRKAIDLGAKAAETDVHMTLDGRVAVMHDATTHRTTGVPRVIAETLWSELQELDVGTWFGGDFAGERLPDLGQLLDVTRGHLVLVVEIKAGTGIVEGVRAEVDARGMRPEVVIFSFDAAAIADARSAMPDVPAVYLLKPQGERYTHADLATAAATGANAVGFAFSRLEPDVIQAAHAAGYPVFVWTVNDPEKALELRAQGVDAIISDAPDIIEAALHPTGS